MKPFPWRSALFASVALNVALIGAGIGAYGAGARFAPPPQQHVAPAAPATPATSATPATPAAAAPTHAAPPGAAPVLPPQARARVRESVAAAWRSSAPLRQEARAARAHVLALARAPTYDAAQMKAALARMRTADERVLASYHDAAADAFARLTPEERRAALTALAARAAERRAALDDPSSAPLLAPPPGMRETLRERRAERRERMRERWREGQE